MLPGDAATNRIKASTLRHDDDAAAVADYETRITLYGTPPAGLTFVVRFYGCG